MKIEKDRVVRFHYTLFEGRLFEGRLFEGNLPEGSMPEGSVAGQRQEALETSAEGEPVAILIGHGNIIPGLETEMEGHEAGDTFDADVAATDAYGEKREGMTQRVPKKHFRENRLVPGMQVMLQTNHGPRAVTIEKVGMSVVDVNLNHPMAGKDLHFKIEIVEVREATAEELEHKHVHGDGGHQH